MGILSPMVLRILGVVALVAAAYFYGLHNGANGVKAGQLDTVTEQFDGFVVRAGAAAEAGTRQGMADFNARLATVDRLASNLRTAQGIMNNAASQLSNSLRGGACLLKPEQRRLLECIRRPDAAACSAAVP